MNEQNRSIQETIKSDLHALWTGAPEARSGKIGYAFLWLLGVPIPVLLLIFFLRGCN